MSAPAYHFADMTFCNDCAFRTTAIGMIAGGLPMPLNMDDAIALMALSQVEAGLTIDVPVAVSAEGTCENCGKHYGAAAPAEDVA